MPHEINFWKKTPEYVGTYLPNNLPPMYYQIVVPGFEVFQLNLWLHLRKLSTLSLLIAILTFWPTSKTYRGNIRSVIGYTVAQSTQRCGHGVYTKETNSVVEEGTG